MYIIVNINLPTIVWVPYAVCVCALYCTLRTESIRTFSIRSQRATAQWHDAR